MQPQDGIPAKTSRASSDSNGASGPQSAEEWQAPPAPPSINLPKGGGAIRGIGEKFAVNPATGSGTMSFPIYTSPGRSGFGPQLSVSYDSGNGNGPFGFGCSLSIPSITRKTDKGLPRYADFQESDVFILSGAEDLVPALEESGGEWTRDVVASRTLYGKQYAIHRYRPRVEGLFAQIERWANLSDAADTFWRSITRDNVTNWYGRTAESRIADPGDASRVFTWLLCETYDDRGNVISYVYKSENSDAVDVTQAHERNRTARSRAVKRYLKHVQYGNRTPYFPDLSAAAAAALPADWCFELVFDYGEHDLLAPLPQETPGQLWNCRLDPFSTYRSAFEVRTYRLCRRALMFHHFPAEANVGNNCLVRSTDLSYSSTLPADPSQPFYSFLLSVTQTGYTRSGAGYLSSSLPQLEFEYTAATIDETVRTIDRQSLANLPYGLDGSHYRWADLDGEGLSGVLTEQGNAWLYKANLSSANQQTIDGEPVTLAMFAPTQIVARKPSLAMMNAGKQQLLDLSGHGQLDLVDFEGPTPGYYERTPDGDWEPFAAFESVPRVEWDNANLKFVDLTGDGFTDLLISEDDAFTWYPSLAATGFGPAQRASKSFDEETGPALVFSDGTESVFLADISGDGLTDLVRVRNGEVCYWPNLGYGRFGAKVTMEGSPRFDRSDSFDGRRIRLADIDGSGTADLIYFGAGSVDLYFNQSGNGWGARRRLDHFPAVESVSSAMAVDLLGLGTACLVWSSPLPGNAGRQMRYIDLMGSQKPHLLARARNNLGAETVAQYAASTKFYVQDKLAGTPWVTRLPFPVQVVERLATFDYVSRNLFVTRYTYHHGFYDGIEREFRGFGRVDQTDTEEFATLSESAEFPTPVNLDTASQVPPVVTKTWFHTGAFFGEGRISKLLAHEYYSEGASASQQEAMLLDDTVLPASILLPDGARLPYSLSGEELREACRALRGSILRQEVYGLDKSTRADRPYRVSERNYTIEVLQPAAPNSFAVFLAHSRETIDFQYERTEYKVTGNTIVKPDAPLPARSAADPRVTHALTLAVDPFGNILRSASVAYGRRYLDPDLSADDQNRQSAILATYAESSFTNAVISADARRTPLPAESRTYELLQVQPASAQPDVTNLFRFDELIADIAAAADGAHDVAFENLHPAGLNAGEPYRRLIDRKRKLYRPDDMGAAAADPRALLPSGTLEPLALPGVVYQLAFTPGLIAQVYQRSGTRLLPSPAAVLGSAGADGGGYVDLDGDGQWWIPSGRLFYLDSPPAIPAERGRALQHFFMPLRFEDAFGKPTTVAYDAQDLLATERSDAANNTTAAVYDYRVLAPSLVTDANGNRTAIDFDALGLVAGTAVMGKTSETLGDLLTGFTADLTQAQIDAFYDAAVPHTVAAPLLGNATTRLVYDLRRFLNSRLAAPADPTAWEPVFAATLSRETHVADLAGGEQSKIQIAFSFSDGSGREIQKKVQAEPGPVVEGGPAVNPRWVASGWTIFNNKGIAVRRYEPFFSQLPKGHQFEFGVAIGVSSTLFYDPPGRAVATLHPNHTYEKTTFDPWRQTTFDVNDTVLVADPSTDPDAGDFFRRMPASDYLPTWNTQRAGGGLGAVEQAAAVKAAAHANTPSLAYFDTLGRAFLTIADNGTGELFPTHVELDIQGNRRSITDALGRVAMRYDYDLRGNQVHQASMEAGERWTLTDISGKPVRAFDSRGHNFRTEYDALRRPLNLFVRGTDLSNSDGRTTAGEVLYQKIEYGEGVPSDQALNLRTRVFRTRDTAGTVTNMDTNPATGLDVAYDFKGNLLRARRQFVDDHKALPNWSGAPALGPDVFRSATAYDALNRTRSASGPDGSIVTPTYNEANLLDSLAVNMRGAGPATGFVANIDYNAKGQRVLVNYGNQTSTSYTYDPLTFRLTGIVSSRAGFAADEQTVQALTYTYDPVGNVTHIQDDADIHNVVFFSNRRVEPSADFTYDATYRLTEASGREQLGLAGGGPLPPAPSSYNDVPRILLPHPGDGKAMGIYDEQYRYDAAGNFKEFIHHGTNPADPGWTRSYSYAKVSLLEPGRLNNQLSRTTVAGGVPFNEDYTYDLHGNAKSMPQLRRLDWDFKDQLLATERQAVNGSDGDGTLHQGERTYYVYDSSGQRVRKTTESGAGSKLKERLYIGGFELYREYAGGAPALERETLHVRDVPRRVALVETTTIGAGVGAVALPATAIRYQYDNLIGTACLELDENAAVITYEEYYPYGSTSYQAGRSLAEVSLKRYRFAGKERDVESGLEYHGARYCAPWIGRWINCDPAGVRDALNLYLYVRDNPVMRSDPTGAESLPADYSCTDHTPHPGIAPAQPATSSSPPPPKTPPKPPAQPQPSAPPVKAAAADDDKIEGIPPTTVNLTPTASSGTARAGSIESEAEATASLGKNDSEKPGGSYGVVAAVRYSLSPGELGKTRPPVRYGGELGGYISGSHNWNDSSRSATYGITARYGRATSYKEGVTSSFGVAGSISYSPTVNDAGEKTEPIAANATGVYEHAFSDDVTLDANIVVGGTIRGGSTTFTNVDLWNTGTVGVQGSLGVGVTDTWTLNPELLGYYTFGSGPSNSAGVTPSVSSWRYGAGIGVSRKYGSDAYPSGAGGVQVDVFRETTKSDFGGGVHDTARGWGAIITVGGTIDTKSYF